MKIGVFVGMGSV